MYETTIFNTVFAFPPSFNDKGIHWTIIIRLYCY